MADAAESVLTYSIDGIFQNMSLFANNFVFEIFRINTSWNFCMKKLCFWYWQHNQFISQLFVKLVCIKFRRD